VDHYSRQPLPGSIRQGSIYLVRKCDPLDDDNVKDRPVIVVDDPICLKGGGPVVVVACSTKIRATDPDAVALPDRGRIPQTKSGLAKPCWAIPRWRFVIERDRLDFYLGHLTGSVLRSVISAYLKRVSEESESSAIRPGGHRTPDDLKNQ
jgi:mRNA-degrading endonuclease toxin of MazEF toxin-antitoxin module